LDTSDFSRPAPAVKPRLYYGYVVVAAAVAIQIIAWGMYNSYGVFFNQLLAEYNWPRETISGAFSLAQAIVGVGAIFLGTLNDRFGPRLLMTFGALLAGLGYVMFSQVHSVWQLYLFMGVIVGFGLSGTDVVLLSTTARWFVKRRGAMSGVVKVGTGIGIVVMPLVATSLISLYGWRITLIIMGSGIFVLCALAAQLLRRDPARMNLLPDGEKASPVVSAPRSEVGLTLKQACLTRQFWMLCFAYFVVVFCTNTMVVHLAPFSVDMTHSAGFAAAMVSLMGGASIFGRLSMGLISDKIGCRRSMLICFVIFIVSFAWVQMVKSTWSLSLFVAVYGFAHGGFYAVMSPVVAELFGTRSHGVIFGIVIFIASLGGALGPIVSGRIFDVTASYHLAFLIVLGMSVLGFFVSLLSRPLKNSGSTV
jgi:MFS family permease